MRLVLFAFLALFSLSSVAMADACSKDVAPVLNTLFSSLGHDCEAYVSLYAGDAKFYHQHDGFKTRVELMKTCQNYAAFCPGNDCRFLQNGAPLTVSRGETCQVLVPYVWSEMPANKKAKANLEPHTGWEYLVLTPDRDSRVGFRIQKFAELETSYSVAFDWAEPANTPEIVAQSTLRLLSAPNSASRGECESPIAPTLTSYLNAKNSEREVWRQQGDAVVLATGGLCHVTLPYSAQVGAKLKTGQFVLTLEPQPGGGYRILEAVEFPRLVL